MSAVLLCPYQYNFLLGEYLGAGRVGGQGLPHGEEDRCRHTISRGTRDSCLGRKSTEYFAAELRVGRLLLNTASIGVWHSAGTIENMPRRAGDFGEELLSRRHLGPEAWVEQPGGQG